LSKKVVDCLGGSVSRLLWAAAGTGVEQRLDDCRQSTAKFLDDAKFSGRDASLDQTG
jgi:hypothetical protein